MLEDARRDSTPSSREVRGRRAHRRGAARHGRLEPRARGLPPLRARRRRARCACTCSTRPSRSQVARGRPTRSTSTKTLFIVSTKSGGTIETLSLFKLLPRAASATAAHFVAVTDPGTSLVELADEHGFRRTFRQRPRHRRALLGAVATSGSCRPRWPASTSARCSRARRSPSRELRARPRATRACGSGSRSASWRAQGRDKLTFVVDAADRVVRPVGRAARRRVAPASRAAASCRSPTSRSSTRRLRRRPRVPAPAQRRRARRRATRQAVDALAAAGHPTVTVRPTAPTTSGGCSSSPSSPPPSPAGCWRSTRSTSPTCRRPRTPPRKVLERGRARTLDDGDLAALLDGLAPPGYLAIMGYLPYADADRGRGRARCARRVIERHGVATTCGYGPRFLHSTGQFHKGGPPAGRFLQLVHDSDADADVPGEPFGFRTLIDAQADGDLQTLRDARPRRPCASACRPATWPAPSTDSQEAALDATRLRRPRQDGRQHGPPHPARLGPRGRRLRLQRGRRAAPPRATARPARPRSRTSSRKLEPPRMVWIMVPAGDPTEQTIDALADAARAGRHDRRRRQHQLARRRRAARPSSTSAGHPLRRRRHLAAASGASRSATA